MHRLTWLVPVLALGACLGADDPSSFVEKVDSAGIEVFTVYAVPTDTVHVGPPAIRIGATGVEAEGHDIFERVSDVGVSVDGRVAVVDNRGGRVALFDSQGSWLADVGARGEGPGEHTAPLHASVWRDSLFVWDVRQRRLSQFTAEGMFMKVLPLPEWAGSRPFAATEGFLVMEVESGQLMDPAPARGAIVLVGRDGAIGDTIVGPYPVPEAGWAVLDPDSRSGRMTNPPALSVYPRWDVFVNSLYWLDPIGATVQVQDLATGAVQQLIRLPYLANPPASSDREAYFQALQVDFNLSDEQLGQERATTSFAELKAPVVAIVVGEGPELWIAPHDPAASERDHVGSGWDVFDLGRQVATHVRFPRGFELIELRGSRAYGITILDNGIRVVDVFDIPQLT